MRAFQIGTPIGTVARLAAAPGSGACACAVTVTVVSVGP